MPLREAHR